MGPTEFFWLIVVGIGLYGFISKSIRGSRFAITAVVWIANATLLLFVPFEVSKATQLDTARISWRFWPGELLETSMHPISYNHLLLPWAIVIGLNFYLRRRQDAPK
jgi:hypothetical protein